MIKRDRIGIFGGTFNPVHRGHIQAAAAVQKRFSLGRVLFVPAFIPPHKVTAGIASPHDRMGMIKSALRRYSRLVPSPVEIEAGGTSYSIRTLDKVRGRYPGAWIFFILGVDAFLEIKTWKKWKHLLEEGLFIVMTRPGHRLRRVHRILGMAFKNRIFEIPKSARIREHWFSQYKIFLVPIDAADISSTDIRSRIREGKAIKGLVPGPVEKHIRERRLYVKTK